MKRADSYRSSARRATKVLACLAAMSLVACDNDVNFNPTVPSLPFAPTAFGTALGADRDLQIVGVLTADEGACLEVTVLYDGEEVEGARTTCPRPSGCTTLEVNARAQAAVGRHTVALRVLRQSAEAVSYRAHGTVRVTRDGLPGWVVTLPLGPTRTRLRAGDSVTFDFEIWN